MRPETRDVTIDGSSSIRLLCALEDLAQTAALAPYRDHIRMLPITAEMARTVDVHRWVDLPGFIEPGNLPTLCLSLAARLVALPPTDSRFREARIAYGQNALVKIQSVGPTVTALDVQHS